VSLLLEIQEAAVGTDVPLAVILRKCQLLAARLGHDGLRDWARSEVEGYAAVADLPAYRKTAPLEAYGSFMLGGVRYFPKLPIPRVKAIPKDRHERLFAHQFLQGVAQLEPLAAADPKTTFAIAWPNDAIALYGDKIYPNMVCLEAHVPITPHMIAGVLDTVRNRVLTFSLEIWKEDPEAGDAAGPGRVDVPAERVDQIFHTYVLAPVAALNVGGGQINLAMDVTVVPGDIESLRAALAQLGVGDSDIRELEAALAEDAPVSGSGSLGPATATWLARVGEQAEQLANGVTAGVLTELLMRFVS
jgi:hypothetical protein